MNSRRTQAALLAGVMLLSAGTAFGLGSKGGGMEEKKGTGMMQDEKAAMEKTEGSMQQGTMEGEGADAMQEKKTMQSTDTNMKGSDDMKGGMEQKEPMR